MARGPKQGCVLAPHLFNLFMADLSLQLDSVNAHAPRLGPLTISHLAYAEDIVLLSHTEIGLQRLLQITATYTKHNNLEINISKTKAMRIGRNTGASLKIKLEDQIIEEFTT